MIITEQIREQLLKKLSEGGVSVDFSVQYSKRLTSPLAGEQMRMQGAIYTDLDRLDKFITFCVTNSSIGKIASSFIEPVPSSFVPTSFSTKLEIPEIDLIVDTVANVIALQRELNQMVQVSQSATISGKLTEPLNRKELKEAGEILQTSSRTSQSADSLLGQRFQAASSKLNQAELEKPTAPTVQGVRGASLQFSPLPQLSEVNKSVGSVTELETHKPVEKSSLLPL